MDARRVIMKLDELNSAGRESEGEKYLETWLADAQAEGDFKAELSILSELLGQYRKTLNSEKGLEACKKAISMVHEMGIETTATGATILINVATTMQAFGKAEDAMSIFEKCKAVYGKTLEKGDYRIAPLYNNMALCYEDLGLFDKAEECFYTAVEKLEGIPGSENDKAASYCNLAELYDRAGMPEEKTVEALDKAYELLNSPSLPHDSYHSFTIGKCIPTFDRYGMFLYSMELKARKEKIDELYR